MKKENVLQVLRRLGFVPKELSEEMYQFEFARAKLLFMVDGDDANCLTFIYPCIYEMTDENYMVIYDAMQRLCRDVKYVQPYMMDNHVWLNYQHYLVVPDVTEELLIHMIYTLDLASNHFNNTLKEIYNEC